VVGQSLDSGGRHRPAKRTNSSLAVVKTAHLCKPALPCFCATCDHTVSPSLLFRWFLTHGLRVVCRSLSAAISPCFPRLHLSALRTPKPPPDQARRTRVLLCQLHRCITTSRRPIRLLYDNNAFFRSVSSRGGSRGHALGRSSQYCEGHPASSAQRRYVAA